ncbi:hypothetical protein C8R44DRAFT_732074 [Mycena epipterygia]|nr:hypothetical protein C8R44DRAFT_732074 [Mycena epipterygia]
MPPSEDAHAARVDGVRCAEGRQSNVHEKEEMIPWLPTLTRDCQWGVELAVAKMAPVQQKREREPEGASVRNDAESDCIAFSTLCLFVLVRAYKKVARSQVFCDLADVEEYVGRRNGTHRTTSRTCPARGVGADGSRLAGRSPRMRTRAAIEFGAWGSYTETRACYVRGLLEGRVCGARKGGCSPRRGWDPDVVSRACVVWSAPVRCVAESCAMREPSGVLSYGRTKACTRRPWSAIACHRGWPVEAYSEYRSGRGPMPGSYESSVRRDDVPWRKHDAWKTRRELCAAGRTRKVAIRGLLRACRRVGRMRCQWEGAELYGAAVCHWDLSLSPSSRSLMSEGGRQRYEGYKKLPEADASSIKENREMSETAEVHRIRQAVRTRRPMVGTLIRHKYYALPQSSRTLLVPRLAASKSSELCFHFKLTSTLPLQILGRIIHPPG